MHRPLDKGAFGVAWLAEDSTKPGVYAVVKFLASSPLEEPIEITQARFAREREILSVLDNQHLCRLLDDDLTHNPPWVAIDYLPGKSLQGTVSVQYQLDETEWFRLASDMLNGLAYLHKKKIIHRDLNPKNILVTSIGYKIIDFGISYKQGLPQVTVGNLHHLLFTSPEQMQKNGKITAKSDIFSLATLLVYAGTNRSPWTNDPNVMNENVSPMTWGEIPANTVGADPIYHSLSSNQKLFLRELHQKDPAKRPTADEALELLKKLATRAFLSPVTNAPVSKRPVQGAKPKPRPVAKAPLPPVKAALKPAQKATVKKVEPVAVKPKPKPVAPKPAPKPKKVRPEINIRKWKIAFLLVHGLSVGLFTPFIGIPFAIKARRPRLNAFVASNTLSTILIFKAIADTPTGGETSGSATVLLVFNIAFGFFVPLALREPKKAAPVDSEKIDPLDDEELLADAHEKYQAAALQSPTWEKLHALVKEVLEFETLDRFIVEFSKTSVAGIYFQGFREDDGAITIEAAANLSVKPEISPEQNSRIIAAGWEPPAGSNPNYAQFLSVGESTLENVSNLIISTLRDGYGASLDGLEPIFSVSNGGELVYVNFAEFKRLTS